MPKKSKDPYDLVPEEIKAMTYEELTEEQDKRKSPEGRAHWNALVKARDDAQQAMQEYHQRGYDIMMVMAKILADREKKKAA